jgi:hypothetical protein
MLVTAIKTILGIKELAQGRAPSQNLIQDIDIINLGGFSTKNIPGLPSRKPGGRDDPQNMV